MFLLLRYDLIARPAKAENDAELRKKLRTETDESLVKLGGDSEDNVLSAWKAEALEDNAYFGWKMNGVVEEIEAAFYSRNAILREELEEFLGYRLEWEENEHKNNVKRTVNHLTRLDALFRCRLTLIDNEVRRIGQRQTLFSALYGRFLRRAIASTLNVACNAVYGLQAAIFDIDRLRDKEGVEV